MTIKAIETAYNGYRFRSRLEARWAVFLRKLGIEYRYEEQGFELPSGLYLPDFTLPNFSKPTFLEVKGKPPGPREMDLASQLAQEANACVYIAYGECWIPFKRTIGMYGWTGGDTKRVTYIKNCDGCDYLEFSVHPLGECDYCSGVISLTGSRLMDAYRSARQARFEHGESG